MNRILLSAVLASASTAVFSSAADVPPVYRAFLPPEQHQGEVAYISGGLTEREANAIKRASQEYPLELVFRQPILCLRPQKVRLRPARLHPRRRKIGQHLQ